MPAGLEFLGRKRAGRPSSGVSMVRGCGAGEGRAPHEGPVLRVPSRSHRQPHGLFSGYLLLLQDAGRACSVPRFVALPSSHPCREKGREHGAAHPGAGMLPNEW